MKRITYIMLSFFVMLSVSYGEDDPILKLKNHTMQYFKPVQGEVIRADGDTITMTFGADDAVKPGMRLRVIREGAPFLHPVTKEFLGKVESTVGKVEIREVQPEYVSGVVVEGEVQRGDTVRISETKIRLVFCQDKNMDWYLADEYYRRLKETERIEMIDTSLETDEEQALIEEAKKLDAEVALLLTARGDEEGTVLRERLFWVSDGSKFIDTETHVDVAYTKDLKFGEEFFAPGTGEAVLTYDLDFGARLVSTGDFDGDGKQEIMLSTGKDVRVYLPSVDLQFLWEVKGARNDSHLWIGSLDLNNNGKDELIITSIREGEILSDTEADVVISEDGAVVSDIYELSGTEFRKLWQGWYFLRATGSSLLAQKFSNTEGFSGDVLAVKWDGDYRMGDKVPLPAGVNIYDFVYLKGTAEERFLIAYDEKGFLNLFDQSGIRTWRSSSDTGGFLRTFEKKAPTTFVDRGQWSVKDRLIPRQREVLVAVRVPIAGKTVKGIGYRKSRIKNYWWNGLAMEEGIIVDDIPGGLLDYALVGDKLVALSSPMLGIKFKNILKGENPFGALLILYSLKGR